MRGDLWTNWLLLTARILHWFNPVAWWTVREMQAEREAACDELAFAALGETDRSAYAATIVELAASLAPSGIAPGLIGLFSSTCRLKTRVERLLRSPSVTTLRAPIAAGLLLGMALMGLTDAMPGARAQAPKGAASTGKEEPEAKTHTVSGRCVNQADRSPLAGVSVRLYRVEGRTSPPVEIARTVTDADGRYHVHGSRPATARRPLRSPELCGLRFRRRPADRNQLLPFRDDKEVVEHSDGSRKVDALRQGDRCRRATGRRSDRDAVLSIDDRPIPGLLSATTDAEGRFKLDDVGVYKWPDGKAVAHRASPCSTRTIPRQPARRVRCRRMSSSRCRPVVS